MSNNNKYNVSIHTREQNNHHSDQMNSNNAAHRSILNNRSNQLNQNNRNYHPSNK